MILFRRPIIIGRRPLAFAADADWSAVEFSGVDLHHTAWADLGAYSPAGCIIRPINLAPWRFVLWTRDLVCQVSDDDEASPSVSLYLEFGDDAETPNVLLQTAYYSAVGHTGWGEADATPYTENDAWTGRAHKIRLSASVAGINPVASISLHPCLGWFV